LRYQVKAHAISKRLSKEKIKFLPSSPPIFHLFIFVEKNNRKTKKNVGNIQILILACGVRANLFLIGRFEITKTEKQLLDVLFCHPHRILAEIFSKASKRKYRDKTNMVPRMQSICKYMIERK
jgi:hypothetical protein